eukprot:scaffold4860_cov171-Amphora_coffeaeformis.AAC.14
MTRSLEKMRMMLMECLNLRLLIIVPRVSHEKAPPPKAQKAGVSKSSTERKKAIDGNPAPPSHKEAPLSNAQEVVMD